MYYIMLMKVKLFSCVVIAQSLAQLTGSIVMERSCDSYSKTTLHSLTGTVMILANFTWNVRAGLKGFLFVTYILFVV